MTALPRASRATELSLVGMAVIWGVNFSVMKYGTQNMSPVAYNFLRMSLACVILLAIAYARPGLRPSTKDRNRLLALGVLGHFVYQMFFLQGLSMTRAGTAALVVAASPAAVAIVARLSGHEKLPLRAVMGIVLSISGVMLVVGGSVTSDGTGHLLGDLLILCAVIVWAFYTTGLVPLAQHIAPAQVAAWTLVGGVVPLAFVATPALLRTDWAAVTPLTWGAVLYSGILAMVVAYLIWYYGVRAIGATRTAMFANLQPLVAVLFAWAVLGEVPTIFQGAGAAAVLGGLYLARR
jgi:drug/metabolite transporter (DMT)-like permease